MTPGGESLFMRLRARIAGKLFLLAGLIHPAYDVWLDDAEPRHPR